MKKNIFKIIIRLIIVLVIASGVFLIFRNKGRVVKIENQNAKIADTAEEAEKTDQVDGADVLVGKNQGNLENLGEEGNGKTEKTDVTDKTNVTDKINSESRLVGFGFQKSSGRIIDTVIIHSSYDALGANPYDVSGLIKEYQGYGVAPHYLVDRKGIIYKLVDEKNIAYHAGEGQVPDGRSGVNKFSIGIEMMNTKTDKYTSEQYTALKNLLADIKKRYKIKYVLGHKDIAPGRKDDPWNFDSSKIK